MPDCCQEINLHPEVKYIASAIIINVIAAFGKWGSSNLLSNRRRDFFHLILSGRGDELIIHRHLVKR
jgi:hypothetical protein